MNKIKSIQVKKIKWILLGCASFFFFIRGIHLISTGGGWIATVDQPFHWFLLFFEIFIAGFSILGCFYLLYREFHIENNKILRNPILIKTVILAIMLTFIVHFIRVGFWLQNI